MKVLINDSFKRYLIQQPQSIRKKIRKQFEFLEIGCWDGGLRVKKLKCIGPDKSVLEARLDRSQRLLLTLGMDESTQTEPIIYVWGIYKHDDVISKSRSLPKDVPFLQFKPYEELMLKETLFEDMDRSHFTQENITQKVEEDFANQKWHLLNPESWDRIETFDQKEFEMMLYLTPSQRDILQQPLPILVSGTAGSGKTTLSIYYLLRLSLAKQKKCFITYNKFLLDYAKKLFFGLLSGSPLEKDMRVPDFYTFQDFCLSIAKHFNLSFPPEQQMTYDRFSEIIFSHRQAAKFNTPLIWEEIRSIIKGGLPQINIKAFAHAVQQIKNGNLTPTTLNTCSELLHVFARLESLNKINDIVQKYVQTDLGTFARSIPLYLETKYDRVITTLERILKTLEKDRDLSRRKYLSFTDYKALSHKKAPNFPVDRKIIYNLFEWYQRYLDDHGLWDELDLTRQVLARTDSAAMSKFRYDVVICDEIQDLTDIQQQLFLRIANNPMNVLFCGDSKQIINPSGFRWEDVKRHFYDLDLPIPDIRFLNLNFRSSGSIVELSNILLDIKSALLGVRTEEQKEDWKYKGRPPVVLDNITEPVVIKHLEKTGANKTILVRTEKEKETLQTLLRTELVFTIYEAKGMEFDTILLWKFNSDLKSSDVWGVILKESNQHIHQAFIRHEINLLYVAITRAQKELLIYDGKTPSVIWHDQRFSDQVYKTDDLAYVDEIWNVVSSPEEWLEQGDYFFDREFYRAAVECYKNAGKPNLVEKAQTYEAEKRGQFKRAANGFEKLGDLEKAASYYEKSKQYRNAFSLFKKLKKPEDAFRCRIQMLEKEGKHRELATIYLDQKKYDQAVQKLVLAGQHKKAGDVLLKQLKNKSRAAEQYEKARSFKKAAKLYQSIQQLEKAAELYEDAKDYTAAIRIRKRLKQKEKLIPLYHRTGDYGALLKIYEKERDFQAAVKILKKQPDKSKLQAEANEYHEKRRYFPALIRYVVINDVEGMADCHFRLKQYDRAAPLLDTLGQHFKAGEAYAKAKNHTAAFKQFILSDQDKANDYRHAKNIAGSVGRFDIDRLADQFYKQEQWDRARVCYLIIHHYTDASFCAMHSNQLDLARDYINKVLHDQYWLNDISRFALQYGYVDFCAQVFLKTDRTNFMSAFDIEPEPDNHFFTLMDHYFDRKRTDHEQMTWIYILDTIAEYEITLREYFKYLERFEYYNQYVKAIDSMEFRDDYLEDHFRQEFIRQYEDLKNDISEIAAIKLFFIGKDKDANRIVDQLQIKKNNYLVFAISDRYEESIEQIRKHRDFVSLQLALSRRGEYLRLADIFAQEKIYHRAAELYSDEGYPEKAAPLFEKDESYTKAGDAYRSAKDYKKAIEMYQKSGRNKLKIAQMYEKLKDYKKAAELYHQLKKTKKARQCMEKYRPSLFD